MNRTQNDIKPRDIFRLQFSINFSIILEIKCIIFTSKKMHTKCIFIVTIIHLAIFMQNSILSVCKHVVNAICNFFFFSIVLGIFYSHLFRTHIFMQKNFQEFFSNCIGNLLGIYENLNGKGKPKWMNTNFVKKFDLKVSRKKVKTKYVSPPR